MVFSLSTDEFAELRATLASLERTAVVLFAAGQAERLLAAIPGGNPAAADLREAVDALWGAAAGSDPPDGSLEGRVERWIDEGDPDPGDEEEFLFPVAAGVLGALRASSSLDQSRAVTAAIESAAALLEVADLVQWEDTVDDHDHDSVVVLVREWQERDLADGARGRPADQARGRARGDADFLRQRMRDVLNR